MQIGLHLDLIAQILFWTALFLAAHTYLIYPLLVFFVGMIRNREPRNYEFTDLPTVCVAISVYNEETFIAEKLKNLYITDYPTEKTTFLFGSDGSTDGTNDTLRSSDRANVVARLFSHRRGKAAVLNDIVGNSHSEIIVFSDANTMFRPDTVRMLVQPFADPTVGAVCGELVVVSDSQTTGGFGERLYWKLENMLKTGESRISSTLGATGAVYAIRKSLFVPLPLDRVVMDDFLIPMGVLKKGFRIVYEPAAIAYERSSNSVEGEFRRRIRIAAGNFNGISEYSSLLAPRNGFLAFALWSHKLLRWVVPFLFLIVLGSTAFAARTSPFFLLVLWVEIAFLFVAILGFILDRLKINAGIFGMPYYFVAINCAMIVGFIRYLFGRQQPTWEIVR